MIGRWSEFRAVRTLQSVEVKSEGEQIDTSGDDGEPFIGSLVGEFKLSIP